MRTTHAAALTCAALAAAATHAGTPTVARWAAPVGGAFVDPSRWVDGVLPNSTTAALIDAIGAPYTIQNLGLTLPTIPLLTLDSEDATLRIGGSSFQPNFSWAPGNLVVRAGVLEFSRTTIHSAPDRSIRIGERGSLVIPTNGMSGFSANRLSITNGLSLLSNEGLIELGRNTELVAVPPFTTTPSTTLINANAGRVHGDAAAGLFAGTIINDGAMVFTGRPDSSFPDQPVTLLAGAPRASGVRRTEFHHSGSITLHDAAVEIVGSTESTGRFTVDTASSLTLTTRTSSDGLGHIRLNPGTRFEGGGTVTIQSNDISGDILADNDLRIHGTIVGSISNGGNTTLRGYNGFNAHSGEFTNLVSGGRLNFVLTAAGMTVLHDLVAHSGITLSTQANAGPLVIGRDLRLGAESNIGLINITVGRDALLENNAAFTGFRSLSVADNLTLGADATLSGSFADIGADLILGPGATLNAFSSLAVRRNLLAESFTGTATIAVLGDAVINSDASIRSLRVDGVTTVDGNLTTTHGVTTLNDGSTIAGRLSAASTSVEGRVSIGSFAAAPSTTITLDGELTLTGDTSLTTSRITLASLLGDYNDFTSRIVADVVLTRPANQAVPSFQSAVFFANDLARTLEVTGHMTLTGRLALTYLNLNDAAFGQSFTLIHATDGLTGQFDPLTLPSLPNGLSLELVYDPHSLTLRVIPTPGAASVLALAGLAATRRRRSR